MSVENFKRLVKDLGQNVGLPELSPDEDDYCCLGFDDKIIVHLQYSRENDMLMMFCQIGTVEKHFYDVIFPRILKANMFWQGTGGATLGADAETGEVLMAYQMSVQFMEYPKFQELLEGFINTAELWINTLEAVQKDMPSDLEDEGSGGSENFRTGTLGDQGMGIRA